MSRMRGKGRLAVLFVFRTSASENNGEAQNEIEPMQHNRPM